MPIMTGKKEGKSIEVVFVSSDQDDKQFEDYFGTMPWHAIPLNDKEAKGGLSALYKVQGIPNLVVVNKDGKVVDSGARNTVTSNPSGAVDEWLKNK